MLSNPEFGFGTSALEAARVFGEEIRGKCVVITGVSPSSIGSGLALSIASQSPSLLILASRTVSNIQTVTSAIHALYPSTPIQAVALDLSNLASIRSAAKEIKKIVGGGEIDILFNNAGINISWRELTAEGYELQFATNHLGGFLLTSLLLPLMLKPDFTPTSISSPSQTHPSPQKRIINTTSEAHRISPIRFSDLHQTPGAQVPREEKPRRGMPEGVLRGGGGYEPAVAYGQSKTANVLFGVEVNRRFVGRGVGSWAVSPGNIMTNLVRGADEQMLKGMLSGVPDSEWKTVDQGAATLVVAGFDPKLDVSDGVYLHDCQMKRPSKWATDPVVAERLWDVSEELVGEKPDLGNLKGDQKKLGGSRL
ncbi:NAD(P)-binding protein [Cadophora sp. DSE1049]|nr:NAD(P)-binding protein [Cadophora sp. DSE1049]